MVHETIKILNDLPRVTVEEYRRHLIDLNNLPCVTVEEYRRHLIDLMDGDDL